MSKPKTKPARLIVATSDTDADMLYATKFWAPDPFIFLERNGKRTLVLSDLEIDRGRKQADADEFVMFSEIEREVQGKSKKAPPYEKVLAHFLKKRGVRSVVVPANFALGYAEELAANKIRVRATNGFFWPEREAKSEKEVGMMSQALRITERGLKRAIEILKASKPGAGKRLRWNGKTLTSEMLRAEIDSTILRAGGIPAGTIVAGGDQACDPHERGYGPLYADSLIILDVFPRDAKTGYFGDMTRTVLRGRASEGQRKLWETVKSGQSLALKRIKAGVDGMTIHKAIQEFFAKRGFPTEVRRGRHVGFFHGTGHGLGLEIHEYPRLQKVVLKDRQVVTVEPGLYYPGLGGARLEDVVLVTKTGCRILSVSKATGDLIGTVNAEKLRALALDLNRTAPRSPRAALANFPGVAARLVDKCRAELVGWNGAYHYNCPMDRKFFAACGLDAEALREFIATGANDAEVAVWMSQNAASTQKKITDWSRRFLANPLWRLLDLEDWLHVRASSRKQSR